MRLTDKDRSASFKTTRTKQQTALAEDYTELVADLIKLHGKARTCEIARMMGISHVAAIKAIQRLVRDGYLETSPHKPIQLTLKGKRTATKAKRKHEILMKFLLSLGVPEAVAAADVEGIEHHISPETLKAISLHLQFSSK